MKSTNRRHAIRLGALSLLGFGTTLASAATGQWPFRKQFGTLVIHADFVPTDYEPLFEELMRLRDQVATQLDIRKSEESIDVYLFSQKSIYERYMRQYFPKLTPRRAMFIKSNSPGNVFAYVSPSLAIDLRHETTHALLHSSLPMVPLWLDEGIAEYFEVPKSQRERGNPYANVTRRDLKWRRPMPVAQLEQLETLEKMGSKEYRQAWSWVHFMLHGPQPARDALREYLHSVQRHEPPPALSQLLSRKLGSPERALAQHFGALKR